MAKKKAGRRASSPEDRGDADEQDLEAQVDSQKPIEFETAVEEIEQIVQGLEGGEWSLATSLREYERAIGRLQTCHAVLQDAERHVSLLAGFDAEGNPVTEAIEGDAAEGLEEKRQARSRHRGVRSDNDSSDPSGPPGLF